MNQIYQYQRQPENELRPLYSKRSIVQPCGRVKQIEPNGLYWLRVHSRFVVVRVSRFVVLHVEDTVHEDFVVISTRTGTRIKITPTKFRKTARKLARCPVCHELHYEMPLRGRSCLACQTRLKAAKAGGE